MRRLLERIYRQHRQGLYTLALSITRQPAAAEDAVHDAFVRLYRERTGPRGDAVSYVYAAVRNAAIDHMRRQAARGPATTLFVTANGQTAPDAAAMGRERDHLLRRAIESLPDAQREAVVLRLYAGLTFEQMARTLGEPLGTVNARYRRALEELRKVIGEE